jgi:hypothetical protein
MAPWDPPLGKLTFKTVTVDQNIVELLERGTHMNTE